MSWTKRALAFGLRTRNVSPSTRPHIQLPTDVLVEEERKRDYNPEHFYPTNLGDVLHGKYQVACKLGYGSSSTVWLARDIHRWRWQHNRYVALKICTNNYADTISAQHELELSRHIATANLSHPGFRYVRTILESFEVEGPNGTHVCLVYEPMQEPIWLLQKRFPDSRYPSDLIKVTLQCILSGLDYLHTQCHIIHTDLKPENILTGLDSASILDDAIRKETEEPSPRKISGDRTIYSSRNISAHLTSGGKAPKITDFGTATRGDVNHPLTHPIQPNPYRAPEATLGAPWSYSADIWNLGVMIWDLLEGKPLCDGYDPRHKEYTSHSHLGQLVGLIGCPPKELLDRGTDSAGHFTPSGEFKTESLIRKLTLSDSVTALDGKDKKLFLEFVNKMLRWLPEDRKTAKELLNDPWLYSYLEDYGI